MGLDMYLKAEKYLSTFNEEEKKKNEKIKELFPEIKSTGNLDSVEVKFEVGYWRKANAIHNWFIENCAKNVDDCSPVYVDRCQLEELLALCKKVIDTAKVEQGKVHNGTTYSKAEGKVEHFVDGDVITNPLDIESLLPTGAGFFFGSTNYDEYYLEDIKSTIKIIEYALSLPSDYEFYYRASW